MFQSTIGLLVDLKKKIRYSNFKKCMAILSLLTRACESIFITFGEDTWINCLSYLAKSYGSIVYYSWLGHVDQLFITLG